MTSFIMEPERRTPEIAKTDVLVVGGGPAGFAAAIAAQREGVHTMLIDRNAFLGGTLTGTTLGTIGGLFTVTETEITTIVRGIADELLGRLSANGYVTEPRRFFKTASVAFNYTGLKFVMDDMISAAGVGVLLDVLVVSTIVEADRVRGVIIEGKGGRGFVSAQVVIDATGDGDIAAQAGLPMAFDIEELQFPSAMFRMQNVDNNLAKCVTREILSAHLKKADASGDHHITRFSGNFQLPPPTGTAHCNVTKIAIKGRPVNPLDPFELTQGEFDGRQQIREYERFFRKYVPGFAGAYVGDIGVRLGIRESRRLLGAYVLKAEDVMGCKRFPDAIACGAWPFEIHCKGKDTTWIWVEPGNYYHIPYRSLINSRSPNLIVAGRCISTTHEAQASTRISGACLATGEAAGVAASMAVRDGCPVAKVDINALRDTLRKHGAYLGE
jgi:hypothetical protein